MFNNCKIFVKLAYYTQSRIRNSHRESISNIQINHMASLIKGLPYTCVILFLLSENEEEHPRLIPDEHHMYYATTQWLGYLEKWNCESLEGGRRRRPL